MWRCIIKTPAKFSLLIIQFIIIVELTSLLTVALIGYPQWVSPDILLKSLSHGFWMEITCGFVLSAWFTLGLTGCFQTGFLRVVSTASVLVFISFILILSLGYCIFSWIYSTNSPDLTGFIHLLAQRYQNPTLWQQFIKTELIVFLILLSAIAWGLFEHLRPANKTLGKAHFANGFETQQAGFFKKEEQSLIIGKKYGAPLYSNGFEHVLVFAPTGSGKTRSIGIPSLFHYPYSVVCNDVKLTLFRTTSGYRETVLGHKCYCWAPASQDRQTHCYNPLLFISEDKLQRITDIQRTAYILMPDNKKSDPIWQQASRKLFKVALLYLLDTPERPTTLGEINRLVKQADFDTWLAETLENTTHLDPEFYRNGYSYLNNHEKTRSSILETFSGYFELFDDPMIDAAKATSDFDLRDLRREKITIYVGFTDDDMERLSTLLTLFWQQLISIQIKKIPYPKEEPYPLLCLIDEFSSLGRIERLRRSLKLLREYQVRCILIMQYIAQTYEHYTHDEAKAFTNIKTKIAFATEDIQDAEYISKLLGTRTIRVTSGSINHQAQGHSQSQSYTYQAKPLLRPEEIMRLSANISLILRTGHPPIKAKQWIWYQQKDMKDLVYQPSFVPEQTLISHPFVHPIPSDTLELMET